MPFLFTEVLFSASFITSGQLQVLRGYVIEVQALTCLSKVENLGGTVIRPNLNYCRGLLSQSLHLKRDCSQK